MTENPQKIAVFVPDEEAKAFLAFKEHQAVITLLIDRGVFGQKNAAITLNFDNLGALQAIERRDFLYSSRLEAKVTHRPAGSQKDGTGAQ